MGNISFEGNEDQPDVSEAGASGVALDNVAELWQVDRAALKTACNTEMVLINKKMTPAPRPLQTCRTLRDSMARSVYNELFVWMIDQMSDVLKTKTGKMNDRQPFIGVLDIFGFEFYSDESLIPKGGQVSV